MSHSIHEHANQRGTAHFYMEDELLTLNDNATEHTIPVDYVIHDGKLCFVPKMTGPNERQPLSPESQGEEVEIVVKIGYPGSAVSDISHRRLQGSGTELRAHESRTPSCRAGRCLRPADCQRRDV
jgi:hypothetical protein